MKTEISNLKYICKIYLCNVWKVTDIWLAFRILGLE